MKKRSPISHIPPPLVIVTGACLMGLSYLVLSLIGANLTFNMRDPVGTSGLVSMISLVVTGALIGILIPRLGYDNGIALSTLSSLLFTLMLIVIGLVFGGGILPGTFFTYVLTVGASALTSFLARPRTRRRR